MKNILVVMVLTIAAFAATSHMVHLEGIGLDAKAENAAAKAGVEVFKQLQAQCGGETVTAHATQSECHSIGTTETMYQCTVVMNATCTVK
jgi:hypothetical protein